MRSQRNDKSRTALWLAGIAVLIAAGGVFWLLSGDSEPAPQPETEVARAEPTAPEQPEFKETFAPPQEVKPIEIGQVVVRPRQDLPVAAAGGPTGCLEGVAVDTRNMPLSDVQITLFQGNALLPGAFPGTRQPVDVTAVTGPDGTFRLCDVPAARNYVVVGEHVDYARSEASGFTVEKDSVTSGLVLHMIDGAVIRGVVTEVGGAPLAGARVELYFTLELAFLKPEDQKPWKVSFTDGQGRYAFTHVSATSIRIRAVAESYASQSRSISYALEMAPRDQEVNFELDIGASLPGRVVSMEGAGIKGARVEVNSLAKDSPSSSVAIADDSGYFLLDGMSRETYQLRATAEGFSDKVVPSVDITAGNYTVTMDRRGGVNGWVTNLKNEPVRSFSLFLMRSHAGGEANYLNDSRAFDAEDGRFEFGNLDPGDYVLEARSDDYSDTRSDPFTIEREARQQPQVRIRMGRGGTLTGHVLDAEGKPAAGALVSVNENNYFDSSIAKIFKAIAPSDERERQVKADSDGVYVIAHIPPGTYQVRAEHEEAAPLITNDVVVVDDDASGNRPLDLKLPRSAGIAGRAVDEVSSPLAFCKVQISQPDNGYMDSGTTDRDGYFNFRNLREGTYQVTVNPERVGDQPVHPFIRLVYAQKSSKDVFVSEGQTVDGVLIQLKKN